MISNKCKLNKGDKFNKLTVFDYDSKILKYICRCDCGNIRKVKYADLINGKITECVTCQRRGIKNGEKFYYLTVIGYDSKKKLYICRCDCGNITYSRSWSLKKGKHKSCGCKLSLYRANKIIDNNFNTIKYRIYYNYKRAAKKRGYKFELTKKEFYKLIDSNCYYCNNEPNMI